MFQPGDNVYTTIVCDAWQVGVGRSSLPRFLAKIAIYLFSYDRPPNPSGVGKTYLACALANRVCRMGFSAFYIRMPKLFQELATARADGSYPKIMKKLAKAKVLILDDLGLTPMTAPERRELLEVVEDRHAFCSTIVATQLPIENWHDNIRDPTIADAILDRLIHNAHKINLKGESMRKLLSTNARKNDIQTTD